MISTQVEEMLAILKTEFGLPVPDPANIIGDVHEINRASAEEFRNGLAGKTWQSLTAEFVNREWPCFGYLTPEAYRYYIPALLTAALNIFDDDDSLMYTAVSALSPCMGALYYYGKDLDFEEKQSAFSPRQYEAVCKVIGLAFAREPGRYRHHAAQVLHYGWNQIETPALVEANSYYRELRSFTYTMPEGPELASLYREILTAFDAAPDPDHEHLCGETQDEESAEYALDLRGVRWQSAHPVLLARCYAALSFLSDAAFRYFMPAYLLADILGYESNANPVFHLTWGLSMSSRGKSREPIDINMFGDIVDRVNSIHPGLQVTKESVVDMLTAQNRRIAETDIQARQIQRLSSFNQAERIAIIHYLEYQAKDEFEAADINEALDSYWRPSIQE